MNRKKIILQKKFRYLELITGFFVAVLLISNIASTKIITLFGFTFDGGTLLFPLAYIFGDILTEVYGYQKSRKVIWIGFFCLILMALTLFVIQILPAANEWTNQLAYEQILGLAPRIVLASLIAYFVGEFVNSYLLAKMKVMSKGKALWKRTIGSTLVGQAVDSTLFVTIAFLGVLSHELIIAIILSNYIFKVAIEILFTPLTYTIVNTLKRYENEDYYDTHTDFNPFSFARK